MKLRHIITIFVVIFATCSGQVVEKCRTDTYPPPESSTLPTVVVNLDDPPELRWKPAIEPLKDEINDLISTVTDYINKNVLAVADVLLEVLAKTLPEPYRSEMKGVADTVGLPEGHIVLYNIFYEVFSVCTSIVAEDPQGQLYHARNLDFGLFLGWDNSNDTWLMTERLRRIIRNVDFKKDGETVYQSASFLGYVGLMTAVKAPSFALTLNERFNKEGGFIGIYQWIMGDRSAAWMGFLIRDVMENANSYSEAKNILMTHKLVAPAYFILSGNTTGEGVVITRSLAETLDVQALNITNGRYYLLQTNYDPWTTCPFYDDRRTPGNICMKQWKQDNVGFKSLFNVLSTKPNLNKLTVYTSILTVRDGLTTWMQDCKTPCTPW